MSKETAFAVFCLESYKVYKSLTANKRQNCFAATVCLTI